MTAETPSIAKPDLKRSFGDIKLGEVIGFDPPLTTNVSTRVEIIDRQKVLLPQTCTSGSGILYSVDMQRDVFKDHSCSLLITGETGTGKEVLAQCALKHEDMNKCRSINCAGLQNSSLAESELFGYIMGSHSQASGDHVGLVKMCEDGALFLDEIGWLPEPVQAKLLRFMETREYRRLGANTNERAENVRIIAATNKPITGKAPALIHDLVYRFDHHLIPPPLRERGADILWLLPKPGFLGDSKEFDSISLRALLVLMNAPWEGNVRDLQKFIKRKALEERCSKSKTRVFDTPELFAPGRAHDWPLFARSLLQRILTAVPPEQRDSRVISLIFDIAQLGAQPIAFGPGYEGHCFLIRDLESILFAPLPNQLDMSIFQPVWDSMFPQDEDCTAPSFEFQDCADWASAIHVLCLAYRFMREKNVRLLPNGEMPSTKSLPPLSRCFTSTPLSVSVFEDLLAAAGLNDEEISICRLCCGGTSGRQIAKLLTPARSPSFVNDTLARIRKDVPPLASHLPRGHSGRKIQSK